jgi:phospholipid transport system substrate-binding protein
VTSFARLSGLIARGLALVCLLALTSVQAAAQSEDPVEFMKKVARDLIAASRTGSPQAFSDALNKYGHVPAIGLDALGRFKPQLQPAERTPYYQGMVRFISRYAATESQKYPPSHAEILGPAQRTDKGVIVDSRVVLRDGSVYEVQWLLQPQGGSYRVRDAKVTVLMAEYWLSPFLKDLFEKYIAENGGRVQALMIALNR